jgi:UDP-2,3-diacylglucosamine hydrolase
MLRAVLADLHLGQMGDDLERFRQAVRELRERRVGEVVFLGDVFRTLVGFPRFWDETVRAGLEELEELRRAGSRVVLVEGNRDFFLDTPALSPFRDTATMCHSFTAGGRRFLVEHGDLINAGDWRYRFWRGLSKSGAARLWARLLPLRLAQRVVRNTEFRLSQTNFSHRRTLPVQRLGAEAERHFTAGVDVLLWGHFHVPWLFQRGPRLALVVPGWAETSALAWVEADGTMAISVPAGPHFVDTPVLSWYEQQVGPERKREPWEQRSSSPTTASPSRR